MNFSLLNKKNYIITLFILIVVLIFGLKYGAVYTALGLSLLISVFFLFFEKAILQDKHYTSIGLIISSGLGAVFFINVLSPKVLDTSAINWLLKRGDPAQHFLGWHFFRNDPWSFPPAVINSLNTPIGTTVTYTDSIPLLAFIFKVFNIFLPDTFQYLGLWILICYILQGFFSLLLMRKLTRNISLQILGTMFFIMSPIMLWRAYGHEALMGHWIILASLYLHRSPYNHLKWLLLLFISLLVHPYLFIMCFLIFVVKVLEMLVSKDLNLRMTFLYLFTAGSLIIITLWLIGYFYIGSSGTADGFGVYSMNLNSLFNPQGWSHYFLKDQLTATPGQYEGFNYLGSGVILLLICSMYTTLNNGKINMKGKKGLIIIIIIFTVTALSNVITFSGKTLFVIPLPEALLKLCSIVRASGRFFWPVYYMLLLFILSSLLKTMKTKGALVFFALALSIQFADLSGKFNDFHNMYASDTAWESPLRTDVWEKINNDTYRNIVFVPANVSNNYVAFSMIAAQKGMTINAVYTARDDFKKKELYNNKLVENFRNGIWDSKSVYIVDNFLFEQTILNKKDNDLFLSADGYNLFIPNGALDPQLNSLNMNLYGFDYKVGSIISFGATGNSHLIKAAGWSFAEENATWTEGKQADLLFTLKNPETDLVLSMKMSPLLGGEIKEQRLIVYANNQKIKELSITSNDTYQFSIPKEIISDQLKISLILPDASSPQSLKMNEDERILALSVENLRLDPVSP